MTRTICFKTRLEYNRSTNCSKCFFTKWTFDSTRCQHPGPRGSQISTGNIFRNQIIEMIVCYLINLFLWMLMQCISKMCPFHISFLVRIHLLKVEAICIHLICNDVSLCDVHIVKINQYFYNFGNISISSIALSVCIMCIIMIIGCIYCSLSSLQRLQKWFQF